MIETSPKVYLIATPKINYDVINYLIEVDGYSWMDRLNHQKESHEELNQAETLTEFAGRLCYRSWEPGLNANIRKIRTDRAEYFANLLSSGHGSVLEHANFSFVFHDVSRVFTHELVRHRAGVAISQESLRYVRLTSLGFRVPEIFDEAHERMRSRLLAIVESIETFQRDAAEDYDLDNPEMPFSYKKEVTSALRRIAPMGLSTSIMWTANLRTIRHVINMRTAPGAEEEIRLVFGLVAVKMAREYPLLFQDMKIGDGGVCSFDYPKV